MSNYMFKHIEQRAEDVLRRFGVSQAPVPVEKIVSELNISVAYAADNNYSGILLRKADDTIVMGLNNAESSKRQRFTMAHELGHFYLDPNKKVFVDQKITIDHRNNKPGKSESKKEMYANAFAAAFLMPEKLVTNDFRQVVREKGAFIDEHLTALASRYEVSRDAMKFRLLNLGLIRI